MAVFTPVSEDEARAHLERYGLGELIRLDGVAEGVENTNYRLETSSGVYALTLFERRTRIDSLPFCLNLMARHAQAGIPAPAPHPTRSGEVITTLNGRTAVIVDWLEGDWLRTPGLQDQHAAGAMLARMHASPPLALTRDNPVGLSAWRELVERCASRAKGEVVGAVEALAAETEWLAERWPDELPGGAVHTDYFPDNVLFRAGRVSGVIDYYFACTESFAFDLAVALCAWGFDAAGATDATALSAFRNGYEALRPLSPAEADALPVLCRGAALRFTLTRLNDWLFHDPSWRVTPKDPNAFLAILRHFQAGDRTSR